MNHWNTVSATNAVNCFLSCSNFNSEISSWNLSNVTNASAMLRNCSSFNQNISSWNVGKASNLNSFFDNCVSFDQNLGSWNITSATNLGNMFAGCTLSTANYDALLVGWEAQAVKNNVTFNGGNSKYTGSSSASDARARLISDHTWTITDGGVL